MISYPSPLAEREHQRSSVNPIRTLVSDASDTRVLIGLTDDRWCSLSAKGEGYEIIDGRRRAEMNGYVSYQLDPRLLQNILRGPRYAHWNNAEIGSHIFFERK